MILYLNFMLEPTTPEVKELTAFWTWMEDDGIVRTRVKPGAEIDLKMARENSKAVNSFFTGSKFPLLVDTRAIKSMTRDARQHFTIRNRDSHVNRLAIVIKSPVSKVIANFFMGVNKPDVPSKIFNSEEKAITWLIQFNGKTRH